MSLREGASSIAICSMRLKGGCYIIVKYKKKFTAINGFPLQAQVTIQRYMRS